MMAYKNFVAKVDFDAEAKLFHGEVIGTQDVITFQGRSVSELEKAFKDSIEDYLEFCEKKKKKPEKSLSGRLNLRLDPEVHRQVAILSSTEEESINQWINEAIEEKIRRQTGT